MDTILYFKLCMQFITKILSINIDKIIIGDIIGKKGEKVWLD